MRFRLHCVNDIWELDGVLNEEHGDCNAAYLARPVRVDNDERTVVANNIPIALLGVELHSETADIADGVLHVTV